MKLVALRGCPLVALAWVAGCARPPQMPESGLFAQIAPPDRVPAAPMPTAPPPRPRPPQPVRIEDWFFMVYFDTGSVTINARGRAMISSFVAYSGRGQPSRIRIIGYADTAGSTAANQRLSERRAQAVADAVIARGVPAPLIQVSGVGEAQLAKASADGVAEPLNRRVELLINF